MSWAAVAVGVVGAGTAIYKGIDAKKKEKRAHAEAERLNKPINNVMDEYYENKNIAAGLATGGLPQQTKDYLTQERQRAFGTSINAMLAGGASPNDVSGLFDIYDQSINRIGAQDADQQLKNIQYYMGLNTQLAGEKTKSWAVNEYAPYQNKLAEITQRRAAAEQNFNSAIDQGIGSVSSIATATQNQGLYNSLFKNNKNNEFIDPYVSNTVTPSIPTQSIQPNSYNINTSLAIPQ